MTLKLQLCYICGSHGGDVCYVTPSSVVAVYLIHLLSILSTDKQKLPAWVGGFGALRGSFDSTAD